MKKIFYFLLLFKSSNVLAQKNFDKTLSISEFIQIVQSYHPVVKQANINIDKSKAEILSARGLFDPELGAYSAQKTFDGVSYYKTIQPAITIPTWYGVELSAGFASLNGSRIDPSETTGNISFIGLSVPLAKNLLMDKRRALLKTAKVYSELNEVEKRTILNDLMLEAMSAYWHWVKAYQLYKVASDVVSVNEKRLALVKTAFQLGERPAIDTTESLSQLQSYLYEQSESLLLFKNAGLELSIFLWQKNGNLFLLNDDVAPDEIQMSENIGSKNLPSLDSILNTSPLKHPKIEEYDYKLKALEINRQLKFQELLPSVNLKYNQLGKGYNILKTAEASWFSNNYQLGFSFSIPLRLSEGRAAYRIAKLKINETRLEQDVTKIRILNKLKTVYNELVTLKYQIELQASAYSNYKLLQRGEETRFLNGESSLFLVNNRENKTLDALQKLIKLKAKYFETEIKIQWATGAFVN